MKKILFFFLMSVMAISTMAVFTSCDDDEKTQPEEPVITNVFIPMVLSSNDLIKVTATIVADGQTSTFDVAKDCSVTKDESALSKFSMEAGMLGDDFALYELPVLKDKKACALTLLYTLRENVELPEEGPSISFGFYTITTQGKALLAYDRNVSVSQGISLEILSELLERKSNLYKDIDLF